MNTAYNYKTGKNNVNYNGNNSKKGMYKEYTSNAPAHSDFVEKSLSFIDNIIDFLSSARTLVVAKAFFAFIALLGFLGVIGGLDLGTISLVSGVISLSLLIGVEYVILRD